MKKNNNSAVIATLTLLVILMSWTLVHTWQYAIHTTLLQAEINQLQDELEEERTRHEVDLATAHTISTDLHNQINELTTELAVAYDTIESIRHELQAIKDWSTVRDIVAGLTDAERTALKRIAMAEAGNQGIIGKALVMLTVLNRVECPGKYGSSVEGVILSGAYTVTQPGGGYWTCVPDWECDAALLLVMHGWDESALCDVYEIDGDLKVIYFTNQGYSAYGDKMFQYKDHWFSGFSF